MAESPLFQYFEAVRGRMLALQQPGETTWRDAVERGLAQAHESGDHIGLVQVVQTLCGLLEAEGNIPAALYELDFALTFCLGHPGASGWLQAMKASLLASQGNAIEATAALAGTDEAIREHLDGVPRLKALALVEAVRMITLEPPSPALEGFWREAMDQRRPLEHLFVTTWHVPYLAARGKGREARPLVRTAAALAGGQESLFHSADVAVFERWLRVIGGSPGQAEARQTYFNPLANTRSACLDVWQAAMHRNWAAADIAVEAIERRARRSGASWGNVGAWRAMVAAARDGEPPAPAEVVPPAVAGLTLASLGAAVAGAYAVALAGDKAHAQEWLEWVSRARKRGIESSLETPVSLRRVEGLLAIRASRDALGGKHLAAAAREAIRHGYTTESAVAELQAEELRTRQSDLPAVAEGAARQRLTALGLDPVPHMYVVHHASVAGSERRAAVLTPREREVLRYLAQGLTYRQAAAQLGTAWKTVQTQAHRAYEKLSSSNRTEAIAEARRLGLL